MKTTRIQSTVSFVRFNSFVVNNEQVNRLTIRIADEIPCYVKNENDESYTRTTTHEISDYESRLIAIICNIDPRFGMFYKRAKQTDVCCEAVNAALSGADIEIELIELNNGEKIQTHSGEYTAPRNVVITKIVKIDFIKEVNDKFNVLRSNILDAIML